MAANPSSVAEWLVLARRGDDAARNQLFAACRSYVGLRARIQMEKRLQGKVDASDLVQQSMLDAHRGFEEFSGTTPDEWFAWLNRVVARNAVDLVRHYIVAERRAIGREHSLQGNGSADSDAAMPHEPAAAAQTPSQVVMQWERQLELAAAIERLPADYREVVVMRNILQLPFEEVARRLGRTTGAAQMLWMRAVEKLRGEMRGASMESRP